MGESTSKYKEMDLKLVLAHYSRPEVLAEIVRCSQRKEVVGSFGGVGYARRPDIIEYPQDVIEQVKRGITSFHASEELWSNPSAINVDAQKQDIERMRIGWDLILDIDCKSLDYSKIAADCIIRALSYLGISSISCKFSGNHGFHIAVPFESFPNMINGKETRTLFPIAPRAIAEYLKSITWKNVAQGLYKYEQERNQGESAQKLVTIMATTCGLDKVATDAVLKTLQLTEQPLFDAYLLVGIDTILISSRHLYRQVYSVNEKSGLVSLPINPFKVLMFDKRIASIENAVFSKFKFLDREKIIPGEASELLIQAYDYVSKKKHQSEFVQFIEDQRKKELVQKYEDITVKIPAEFFPPSIVAMFEPLGDGKKRAMFILLNFLRCVGYNNDEINVLMNEWNQKHAEPLRDTYFKGQLRYFLQSKEKIPPPNYESGVYRDITGKEPTPQEIRVRNPIPFAKMRFENFVAENSKPKRKKASSKKDPVEPQKDSK
ncbi:MAG TPA: hypothetical protein VK158_02485 [Acidobacteriota bacterium]|nr:hypothetical protein [Acidobacteriota bacterium]